MLEPSVLEQVIERGPEAVVYFLIEDLGGFIWRMNHDMADGRIPEKEGAGIDKEIALARTEQRRLCVEALPRFGVATPWIEGAGPSDEYWAWYRWWNAWHKCMPSEQWSEVDAALDLEMTDEQIARCRPEGTWKTEGTPT